MTGAVWDIIKESGPRCGVEVDVAILRRLDAGPLDVRADNAAGALPLMVVQRPIALSAEADRTQFEGPWTAMESILPL